MTIPTVHLYYLLGGFFFGAFFMYNALPIRMSSHNHNHLQRLISRQTTTNNEVLKFGNPGPVNDFFERAAYSVSYNRQSRIPHWVGEHLTAQGIKAGDGVNRDKSTFTDDINVPDLFRAYTKDYVGSGYDRGHMAPAGDASSSQTGMDETFLMTNIAPQIGPGFNRQYWAYFERFCRTLTKNYTDVFVYTGPLFLPQIDNSFAMADVKIELRTGKVITAKKAGSAAKQKYKVEYNVIGSKEPNVAVPTHYFKILLLVKDGEYYSGSFVLPNQAIDKSISLDKFQVNLKAIEKASGLQFFQLLDRTKFKNMCDTVQCVV